jgi:hypothetical protein
MRERAPRARASNVRTPSTQTLPLVATRQVDTGASRQPQARKAARVAMNAGWRRIQRRWERRCRSFVHFHRRQAPSPAV